MKKLNFTRPPVKAGAQAILNGLKTRSERDWIPAFAGMTWKRTKSISSQLREVRGG